VLAVHDQHQAWRRRAVHGDSLERIYDFYEREWVTGQSGAQPVSASPVAAVVRHRTPNDGEVRALWKVFDKEGDPARAACALLLFTGCRRREVTQMRRTELELDASLWTLPAERRKTGRLDPTPFRIQLHPAAVDLLRAQPELQDSPFGSGGRRDEKPFDFQYALMQRVRASIERQGLAAS